MQNTELIIKTQLHKAREKYKESNMKLSKLQNFTLKNRHT